MTHTSVRGGISTCKPKPTRSSILYLPSSASTEVASALGQPWNSTVLREEKAAAIAKRGQERIQNSNHFFPELLLIWRFVHRPSVFKTSVAEQMLELWLPCPQLAAVLRASRWLQVTPGDCSRSGLTRSWTCWSHVEGSNLLNMLPNWPHLFSSLSLPALYLLPLRKRKKEMFSKKKFNETKCLYFHLLTLDLCFSGPAIWDKSLTTSLHPMV